MESANGFCPIFSGAGYAFRREAIGSIPADVWADDVYVPLLAHSRGFSCICVPDIKALEHRGPGTLTALFFNKIRKSCDIIKEFMRFIPDIVKMRGPWRVIYATKFIQIIFSPFLFIGSILFFENHILPAIFLFFLLVFLQDRVMCHPGSKRIGVWETLFVFTVTEFVLAIAVMRYFLNRNKIYYVKP